MSPPAAAVRAAALCAADPALGGMVVRGAGQERAVAALAAALPAGTRVRRLPVNVRDDQLDGGIDLAAALAGRTAARAPGLLDGQGLLVVPMAGRLAAATAARIAGAIDRGMVVVALEEADEPVPAALAERLAFRLDLDRPDEPAAADATPVLPAAAITTLATAAAAFGIASVRADLLAHRAAHAAATLAGRAAPHEGDLAEAVRLVLVPRATRLPAPPEQDADAPAPAASEQAGETGGEVREIADRVIAAAAAAIDPRLLDLGDGALDRHGSAARSRGAGERRRARERGRPVGTRAGDPRAGGRLALVETLRAAAPWQRLRGRTDRVLVRGSDLRVWRLEAKAEAVAIFAVDASGSSAMARMAEAKGAVELLLGQAYVRRAQVALTAFRGQGAELLLPPTRSLTRARRALAALPGGGGTPLADGLQAALDLARAARGRGRTPMVVVLSDGRANLAAGGISAGRPAAERDALAAARALRVERVPAIFVDTGARPRPEGARVADAMGARYLPLPFAGAAGLGAVVDAFAAHAR